MTPEVVMEVEGMLEGFLSTANKRSGTAWLASLEAEGWIAKRPIKLRFASWSKEEGYVKLGNLRWELIDTGENGVLEGVFQLKYGIYSVVNSWTGEELLRVMGYIAP